MSSTEYEALQNLRGQVADLRISLDHARTAYNKLDAELQGWRDLHTRTASMVIPGVCDSSDAYRNMFYKMRDALLYYTKRQPDSVEWDVYIRRGRDALKYIGEPRV